MAIAKRAAHLIAHGTCPGIEEALGWTDAWQVRRGVNWLVTREGAGIVVRRGEAIGAPVATFPDPTGELRGYAKPAPDAGFVVVCGDGEITAVSADGGTQWSFRHLPWSTGGGSGAGACGWSVDGKHVIATVPGPLDDNGVYPGDLCVVLDATDGSLVTEQLLKAFSGIYEIRQPLAGPDVFFVSAGQGQDEAMSYLVSFSGGTLLILPAGAQDEPISGVDAEGRVMLKLERGGACITAYTVADSLETEPKGRVDATALVGDDGEERIVGRPGFVDEATVIAAVAEEEWAEEAHHFLLDADTLQVLGELEYPVPVGPDPLSLGDGTWLTTSGDEVYRWSTESGAN